MLQLILQGFPDLKITTDHCPDIDEEGNVPSYQAAVCLLEQVSCLNTLHFCKVLLYLLKVVDGCTYFLFKFYFKVYQVDVHIL